MVVMSLWDELRVHGGSLYAVCIQMTGLYFHYSFNVLEGQSDHLERPRSKSITFVRQILRRAPCRRNGCFRVGAAEADGGSLCSRAALILVWCLIRRKSCGVFFLLEERELGLKKRKRNGVHQLVRVKEPIIYEEGPYGFNCLSSHSTSDVIRQKVQAVFVERTSVTGICKRAETSQAHRHDNCLI